MLTVLRVVQGKRKDKNLIEDKYIEELSNRLIEIGIEHVVVNDEKYGIAIMPIDDAPSYVVRDNKKNEWKYLEKRFKDKNDDNGVVKNTYIVEDSNKNIDILNIIHSFVKIQRGEINEQSLPIFRGVYR